MITDKEFYPFLDQVRPGMSLYSHFIKDGKHDFGHIPSAPQIGEYRHFVICDAPIDKRRTARSDVYVPIDADDSDIAMYWAQWLAPSAHMVAEHAKRLEGRA